MCCLDPAVTHALPPGAAAELRCGSCCVHSVPLPSGPSPLPPPDRGLTSPLTAAAVLQLRNNGEGSLWMRQASTVLRVHQVFTWWRWNAMEIPFCFPLLQLFQRCISVVSGCVSEATGHHTSSADLGGWGLWGQVGLGWILAPLYQLVTLGTFVLLCFQTYIYLLYISEPGKDWRQKEKGAAEDEMVR